MHTSTKKITQGAMICALTGVFLLLDRYMGTFLTSYLSWALSIPILVYASQNELKYAGMVLVGSIIIALLLSPLTSVFYLLSSLILGLIFGYGVRKGWKSQRLLFWTIFCSFISNLCFMYIFAAFFGYDLVAMRAQFIQAMKRLEILGHGSFLFMNLDLLYDVLDIVSFLMLVILESLCVYLVSFLIFKKMHMNVKMLQIEGNLRYPKVLSIGGILSIVGFYLSNYMPMDETILFILVFFCLSLFIVNFVYGMIVLRCMRQIPKWIWIVALILPLCWPFVMILGIVDGLVDGNIRKRGLYGKTRKF